MIDISDTNDLLDFMKDSIEVLPDQRTLAVKEIDKYYFTVTKATSLATMAVIEDRDSCQSALDIAGDIKNLSKKIDDDRKRIIEPYRKIVSMVNDCAKNFQNSLETAENVLKFKLANWHQIQESKALEAQKAAKDLSESLGLDISIIAPDAPKNLSSEKASTVMREKVTFEIVDESLIPEEYWIIDEDRIQKDIDMGKRTILGVKIKTEKQLIIRRK